MLTIQEEVESLRLISEEFSEFARMPKIDPKKENLNDIIKNIATFIESAPGSIGMRLKLDENLSLVLLDRPQFRRALYNSGQRLVSG